MAPLNCDNTTTAISSAPPSTSNNNNNNNDAVTVNKCCDKPVSVSDGCVAVSIAAASCGTTTTASTTAASTPAVAVSVASPHNSRRVDSPGTACNGVADKSVTVVTKAAAITTDSTTTVPSTSASVAINTVAITTTTSSTRTTENSSDAPASNTPNYEQQQRSENGKDLRSPPGSPVLQSPCLYSPVCRDTPFSSSQSAGEEQPEEGTTSLLTPSQNNEPNTNFTHTFLKSILASIDSRDAVVANAWLETLLDVMDLLPRDVIKEEILPVAVAKSQSPDASARLASSKLIGKLTTKLEPFLVRQEVCGAVQSLSQDVSGEVRAGACVILPSVSASLGLETTRSHLLPDLVDLCSDDEVAVRLAAIHALVGMLPGLDHATRVETVIPLVRKVCERCLRVEDASLTLTAHLLGPLCHALHDDMSDSDKRWFLELYCKLSVLGLPADVRSSENPMPDLVCEVRTGAFEAECRQQCAFNFPGMLMFAGNELTAEDDASATADSDSKPSGNGSDSRKKDCYKNMLLPVLSSFVMDQSISVRVTIAKAFHQVCLCLGSCCVLLRAPLLQLLHSDHLDVLQALLPSLPHVLQALHPSHTIAQAPSPLELELVPVLLRLEERVLGAGGGVWRQHADVLHHIARLVAWLPTHLLLPRLVPRMVERMHTARPLPCRVSAARTLLVCLQQLPLLELQKQLANTIVTEFAQGASCHQRMLFLTLCNLCLEMLPERVFKTHFIRHVIEMHRDRVANIRLRVVSLLPSVKEVLQLPDDRLLLQSLETAVGGLLVTETDRDVVAAVAAVIPALERIHVPYSPPPYVSPPYSSPPYTSPPYTSPPCLTPPCTSQPNTLRSPPDGASSPQRQEELGKVEERLRRTALTEGYFVARAAEPGVLGEGDKMDVRIGKDVKRTASRVTVASSGILDELSVASSGHRNSSVTNCSLTADRSHLSSSKTASHEQYSDSNDCCEGNDSLASTGVRYNKGRGTDGDTTLYYTVTTATHPITTATSSSITSHSVVTVTSTTTHNRSSLTSLTGTTTAVGRTSGTDVTSSAGTATANTADVDADSGLGIGSRGGVRGSGRRSSGLPSYVGGSRRLSAVLPPPKLPPDRSTVMRSQRNSDSFHEDDLRQLCDKVLLSPQDPSTANFSWDDVVVDNSSPRDPSSSSCYSAVPGRNAQRGYDGPAPFEEPGCEERRRYGGRSSVSSESGDGDGKRAGLAFWHNVTTFSSDERVGLHHHEQQQSYRMHMDQHYRYNEKQQSHQHMLQQQQHLMQCRQQERRFTYPDVPASASTTVTDSVIYKAQQKIEQATGFKLPKEIVKLGSQLVGSDIEKISTSGEHITDTSLSVPPKGTSYSSKSPESLPQLPSTQTLLATLKKPDPSIFTEDAWQTCKMSKLKLCDKLASYREKANSISSKELFWLRSSRPRWRRKVASADTSPEELNRQSRFTRGLSEDSAQRSRCEDKISYSGSVTSGYGESEDVTDVSQYGQHIHNLGAQLEDGDCASPPSPHGMYTWPPQHARHRHLSSTEDSPTKGDKTTPVYSPTTASLETAVDPPFAYCAADPIDAHHKPEMYQEQYGAVSSRRTVPSFSCKDHANFSSSIGGLGSEIEPNSSYMTSEYKSKKINRISQTLNYESTPASDYNVDHQDSNASRNYNVLKSHKNSANDLLRSYSDSCQRENESSLTFISDYFKGRPQYPLPEYNSVGNFNQRITSRSTALNDYGQMKKYSDRDSFGATENIPVCGKQLHQSTSHPDICFESRLSQRDNRDLLNTADLRDVRDTLQDSINLQPRDRQKGNNRNELLDSRNLRDTDCGTGYRHEPFAGQNTSKLRSTYHTDHYRIDRYGGDPSESRHDASHVSSHFTPSYRNEDDAFNASTSSSRYSTIESKTSEDLYVVHGIPPTIAGRERSSVHGLSRTLSFPSTLHSDSDSGDECAEKSRYDDYPARFRDTLSISHSNRDIYHTEPVYESIPTSDKNDKFRYPYYSTDRTLTNSLYNVSRDYGFYDSGEFASRSSSTAYPIGPLGASWIQQGMMHPPLGSRNQGGYTSSTSSLSQVPRHFYPPRFSSPWYSFTHLPSSSSLSTLDPSTDEFLVDAGIRIDESALRSRLPTPHVSATLSSSRGSLSGDYSACNVGSPAGKEQPRPGGSRLRPTTPTSRIPGLTSEGILKDSRTSDTGSSSLSSSRLRSSFRGPRPVSTTGDTSTTNTATVARTKSLSHENLRLGNRCTSPHMLPDPSESTSTGSPHTSHLSQSAANSSRASGSRLPPRTAPRTTSCSSSPGSSRCTSPGVSSPPLSRCSSPGAAAARGVGAGSSTAAGIGASVRTTSSGVLPSGSNGSHRSSTSDVITPTTPPSPAPQSRDIRHSVSPHTEAGSTASSRRNSSRLPLPTHRQR